MIYTKLELIQRKSSNPTETHTAVNIRVRTEFSYLENNNQLQKSNRFIIF